MLPKPISNHCPIVLERERINLGKTLFRFENMWLKVEGFKDLIRSWSVGYDVCGSLSEIKGPQKGS